MTFDYSTKGEVNISMADYVKLILHDVPKDMGGKDTELLLPKKKEVLVHIVMQMLYLSQRD